MSDMLTPEELELAVEWVKSQSYESDVTADERRLANSAIDKLLKLKRQAEKVHEENKAHADGVVTEVFPMAVTREEAQAYSAAGEQLMLAAAKVKTTEQQQFKLSQIMIGMTTAVCQVTKIPRERFCNQLVSNVMFTALKAAWCVDGPDEER